MPFSDWCSDGCSSYLVLSRKGGDLAITARSEDGVKDAVANLGKYGTKVIGKAVNVKKADDYKAWLAWALDEMDGCDILVPISSAGGGMGSEKYWHNAFEVDVMGPVRSAEHTSELQSLLRIAYAVVSFEHAIAVGITTLHEKRTASGAKR